MHADEIRATAEQVSELIASQCPQWSSKPVVQLPEDREGTDHVLFRIGDDLLARMPKVAWAVDESGAGARWLPVLAPHLPVRIPVPLHVGEPGAGFPWPWTVVPWIDGETFPHAGSEDAGPARQLAAFVRALHRVDTTGAPVRPPGARGASLRHNDENVRAALTRLARFQDDFDVADAEAAWEVCVSAPEWNGDPVWLHGDLQPGNLITNGGALVAVIDFGAAGVGDPAPDVAPALWTFRGAARDAYREAVGYDEATWRRACGWALGPSLTGADYYRETFPRMAEGSRRMIRTVIDELIIRPKC